jgi:hypothetical protein
MPSSHGKPTVALRIQRFPCISPHIPKRSGCPFRNKKQAYLSVIKYSCFALERTEIYMFNLRKTLV